MAIGKIFGVFGISGSGLSAQRKNLEVRAENIANTDSIDKKTGEPYRPKDIEFIASEEKGFRTSLQRSQTRLVRTNSQHIHGITNNRVANETETGVRANAYEVEDTQTKLIYAPDHPHANEDGYVEVADINSIEEMVKLMSAARAYEANATVINAAKDMFKKALEI